MGNKNSDSKSQSIIEESKIEIDHPRIKQMKFKRTKGAEQMEAKIMMNNKKDFQQWKTLLQKNPGTGNKNVLCPIKSSFKESKMCGSGGHANMTYQNFPYLLSYQINSRKILKKKRKFQENQVLADVGDSYHQAGEKVGNIDPRYVFMNQDGVLKIASKFSWPNEKTNYQNAIFDDGQIAYIAPQEQNDLDLGRKIPLGDFRLAQSFSAGLTALDAALLDSSQKMYSGSRGFDPEILQGRRQNLKNDPFYNDQLKHVILNLTEIDPNQRMSLTEIKSWLTPYTGKILNLQTFRPQKYTKKLAETAKRNPIKSKTTLPGYEDIYRTNSYNPKLLQSNNDIYPLKDKSSLPLQPQLYNKKLDQQVKLTKTIQIPGGPTKSYRPKKLEANKVSSKLPQQLNNKYYQQRPTFSSSQQYFSSYTNNLTEPSQPKIGRTSLEIIQEKIRQSRKKFPGN